MALAKRGHMFKSLRTKPMLSHVRIALLVLLLSMGTSALVVKRVQVTVNLARTRSAAFILAQRLQQIPQRPATMEKVQDWAWPSPRRLSWPMKAG